MTIPVCKHCSKAKKYHERNTLHCPNPSRSLAVTYSTENVYEEDPVQVSVDDSVDLTSKVKVSLNDTEIDTIGSGTSNYSFDELKSKIDDYILPLHDKQWVLENIEKNSDADCDDEREDLERWLKACDGSIVLGKPDTANNGTYVMFGMKFDGYLDEVGLLNYITFNRWYDIENAGLIDLNCMEGHMDIDEDEHKGITPFMTEIIGRSMYSDTLPDLKSTADCKAFLKSEYGVSKAKRIKKEKWGKIEYRLFESDQGDFYTIVSYNDKLISHYAFDYSEDY